MPKTKISNKNIVTTLSGEQFRVYSNGLVKTVRRGPYAYVTTAHIFNRIFNNLYRYGKAVEVCIGYGKTGYDAFTAVKRLDNGFSIGCKKFDAKNARKLFLLVGVYQDFVNRYVPAVKAKAKAVAAGK